MFQMPFCNIYTFDILTLAKTIFYLNPCAARVSRVIRDLSTYGFSTSQHFTHTKHSKHNPIQTKQSLN